MKKTIKVLFLATMIFIGLNSVSAAITEENAAKYLKKEYGVEAEYYCHYAGQDPDGNEYKMIIAVSANNKYAYADVPGAWGGDIGFEGEPILNWDNVGECTEYGVIYKNEKPVIDGWDWVNWFEEKAHLTTKEYELRLYKDQPTQYINNWDYLVLKRVYGNDGEISKSCNYSLDKGDGSIISLFFNSANRIVSTGGGSSITLSDEFYYNQDLIGDGCPKIYICKKAFANTFGRYEIFFSDYSGEYDDNDCFSRDGSPGSEKGICVSYSQILNKDISDEQKTNELNTYCEQVFKTLDYTNPCSQLCLDYQKSSKPNININDDHCGFSQRLVDWVMNILRWVKYIVPVLLIVLSILDFIKAIASDKEDEMKKAQKHFTVRLIAAALIFLMPFILEFIFDKMGFTYEDCGIFK